MQAAALSLSRAPAALLHRPDTEIVASVEDLPPLRQLEVLWRDLEKRAEGSFFTSWAWIGAWLATGQGSRRCLVTARNGGKIVGLALVGRTRGRRAGVLPHTTLALHQDGDAGDDALFIEYNAILAERSQADEIRAAILASIATAPWFAREPWNWDDFRIAGATAEMERTAQIAGLRRQTTLRACPWVNLADLGEDAILEGYLARLSRNTRQQLRRACRLAEAHGPLRVVRAATAADRMTFLAALKELHQDYWRRFKHQPGAFAAPAFRDVTARLAATPTGDPETEVELLRLAAGDHTIGVLLNFVHRGHVYAYQSGFAYGDDNRLKPGLVSHALAIVDSARRGRAGYHFMAGDSRYKDSLSTVTETLAWLTFSRRRPHDLVVDGLRGAKSFLQNLRNPKQ